MEQDPKIEQQVVEKIEEVEKKEPAPGDGNTEGVYDRGEYSKAQFWEDRMKETKGFFDWYVEFDELKRYVERSGCPKDGKILMVGCGNSKLSEQMYDAGFHNIINVDIAPTIINLMKEHHDKKEKFMEWTVMDCTDMPFKDQSFDLVIDKGTVDAVICGDDLTPVLTMLREMCRVTKISGHTMIVSNAAPQSRKMIFEDSVPTKDFETQYIRQTLSDKSDLINIMRHNLKDKPLNAIMKDKTLLLKSMIEYKLSMKLRDRRNKKNLDMEKLEYENCKINYRVENIDKAGNKTEVLNTKTQENVDQSLTTTVDTEKTQNEDSEKNGTDQELKMQEKSYVKVNDQGYAPIRQNHCYIYLINRIDHEQRLLDAKKAEIEAQEKAEIEAQEKPAENETQEKLAENEAQAKVSENETQEKAAEELKP